jgi:hypothetical protein
VHVPAILPDELSRGYVGRVMKINGFRDMIALRKSLKAGMHAEVSLGEMLANALRIPFAEFIQRHTFVPFSRAVHSKYAGDKHGSNSTVQQLRLMEMATPGGFAASCDRCISDDVRNHGVAYWRRDHQIPGMVRCPIHGQPLSLRDPESFLSLPTEGSVDSGCLPELIHADANINPAIGRYIEICRRFLQSETPISAHAAAELLARRAKEKGLRIAATGKKANLSDQAHGLLAGPWLDFFFPFLSTKSSRSHVGRLDGVCMSKHQSYQSTSYALALSVLWDEPDIAIDKFFGRAVPLPRSQSKSSAGEIGVSKTRAAGHLSSASKAIRLFLAGESAEGACQQSGIGTEEFENSLRDFVSMQLGVLITKTTEQSPVLPRRASARVRLALVASPHIA